MMTYLTSEKEIRQQILKQIHVYFWKQLNSKTEKNWLSTYIIKQVFFLNNQLYLLLVKS